VENSTIQYPKGLTTQSQRVNNIKLALGTLLLSAILAMLILAIAGILNSRRFANNKYLKHLTPETCFIMILTTLMLLSIMIFVTIKARYDNKAQSHDRHLWNFLQANGIDGVDFSNNSSCVNAGERDTTSKMISYYSLKTEYGKELFYLNRNKFQSFMQWTIGSLVVGMMAPLLLISIIGMINPRRFANAHVLKNMTFEMFLGIAILSIMLLGIMLTINIVKNNTLNSKIEAVKSDLILASGAQYKLTQTAIPVTEGQVTALLNSNRESIGEMIGVANDLISTLLTQIEAMKPVHCDVNGQISQLETKIGGLETKIDGLKATTEATSRQLTTLNTTLHTTLNTLNTTLHTRLDTVSDSLCKLQQDLDKMPRTTTT